LNKATGETAETISTRISQNSCFRGKCVSLGSKQ